MWDYQGALVRWEEGGGGIDLMERVLLFPERDRWGGGGGVGV